MNKKKNLIILAVLSFISINSMAQGNKSTDLETKCMSSGKLVTCTGLVQPQQQPRDNLGTNPRTNRTNGSGIYIPPSTDMSDFISNVSPTSTPVIIKPAPTPQTTTSRSVSPTISSTPTVLPNNSALPGFVSSTPCSGWSEPLSEDFVAQNRCAIDPNYQAALRRDPRMPFRSLAPDPRATIDCRDPGNIDNVNSIRAYGQAWWTQLCGTFSKTALKEMLDRRAADPKRAICKKPLKTNSPGNLFDICNDFPKWGAWVRTLNTISNSSSDWIDKTNEANMTQALGSCGDMAVAPSRTANMIGFCAVWGSGTPPGGWINNAGVRGLPAGTSQDLINFNTRMVTSSATDQRCTNFDLAMNNCNFATKQRVIQYDSTRDDYMKNWDAIVDAGGESNLQTTRLASSPSNKPTPVPSTAPIIASTPNLPPNAPPNSPASPAQPPNKPIVDCSNGTADNVPGRRNICNPNNEPSNDLAPSTAPASPSSPTATSTTVAATPTQPPNNTNNQGASGIQRGDRLKTLSK